MVASRSLEKLFSKFSFYDRACIPTLASESRMDAATN